MWTHRDVDGVRQASGEDPRVLLAQLLPLLLGEARLLLLHRLQSRQILRKNRLPVSGYTKTQAMKRTVRSLHSKHFQ